MFRPLYAYFVPVDAHDEESLQRAILSTHLDECWMRVCPLDIGQGYTMLELTDLESGAGLTVEGLGEALSSDGRRVYRVLDGDPEQQSAAFEVFEDGERAFAWAGHFDSFDVNVDGLGRRMYREGFDEAFAALVGVPWDEIVPAAREGQSPMMEMVPLEADEDAEPGEDEDEGLALELADEHTDLVLRGRLMGIPEGMPRMPQLFRFHDVSQLEDDEAVPTHDEEDEDDEHMALVLLDPGVTNLMWAEAPAGEALRFLEAMGPLQAKVLGPLAHAMPEVLEAVRQHDLERPLAAAEQRDLLVYEVLSMASATVFATGASVADHDERFLPLLSLSPIEPPDEALRASLAEISGRGVLSAMAEVLPYSVPEGEMLDCFADGELSPLAPWAVGEDGVYEGSLFHVDLERLARLVVDFEPEPFLARVRGFLERWNGMLGVDGFDEQLMALHDLELMWFQQRLQELQLVLALADVNRLRPALLFYSR